MDWIDKVSLFLRGILMLVGIRPVSANSWGSLTSISNFSGWLGRSSTSSIWAIWTSGGVSGGGHPDENRRDIMGTGATAVEEVNEWMKTGGFKVSHCKCIPSCCIKSPLSTCKTTLLIRNSCLGSLTGLAQGKSLFICDLRENGPWQHVHPMPLGQLIHYPHTTPDFVHDNNLIRDKNWKNSDDYLSKTKVEGEMFSFRFKVGEIFRWKNR